MYNIVESPQWLKCACGDAVKLDYVKKIYVWWEGFGNRKYYVKADIDGGAKGDEPVIVDIFDTIDDAKKCIRTLIGEN